MPAASAEEYERWLYADAFKRVEERRTLLKRPLDCGCVIDAGAPYRYVVWRSNHMARGVIAQRTDCDVCSRVDLRG